MKRLLHFIPLLAAMILPACNENGLDSGGLPQVETLPVEIANSSTAVLRGSTKGGTANMLCRGVCFSSAVIFSFKDSPCVSVAPGEGEFEVKTYELIPLHQYNMKAFAVMKDGTIVYGDERTISTTDFSLPTVEIKETTEIFATEATFNATLIDEGDYSVTARGFVYTADKNAVLEIGETGVNSVLAPSEGADFSVLVGGLALNTQYRVKAYAMTENGPGYSAEITFSTPDIKPVEFEEITETENTYLSLIVKSSITDTHGATILSSGFCWSSTNKLPSVRTDSFKAIEGEMSISFEDATPGKVYYVRAYAETKENGTNYSETKRFRVKTYDCDGGMIKIVPDNPVYIGWLGDYDQPSMAARYSQAHDGVYQINMSVGRTATPNPSEATLQPFCIAKYEVTNRWFIEFLNIYGSSVVKDGTWKGQALLFDAYTDIHPEGDKWSVDEAYLDYPVVGVTWYGALEFCSFFGGYLPSEAQWEVAARGNVYSNDPSAPMYMYSGSNTVTEVAVCSIGTSHTHVEKVGTLKPNQLGIYDMSGNAEEMTSSWWGNYQTPYKENPMPSNKQIVIRGGRAQRGVANTFQVNTRASLAITAPQSWSNYVGFRFACDPFDED
ncbi:MAG: SUMF1/EgtB/PvdO family nonheme iron enzyme [Bacteroidales bacterium]|nr:SUMF1/EgtB/PvdO family nonheme iron enzyme [Bacteroidales bacterium]